MHRGTALSISLLKAASAAETGEALAKGLKHLVRGAADVGCIDCGACVPVCPVSAIFALDDLPEKWNAFTERNAKYFGR